MILKMEVMWLSIKRDSEYQMCNLLKIYFKNWLVNMMTLSLSYYFFFPYGQKLKKCLISQVFFFFKFQIQILLRNKVKADENKEFFVNIFKKYFLSNIKMIQSCT